jgi:hypothetical protein
MDPNLGVSLAREPTHTDTSQAISLPRLKDFPSATDTSQEITLPRLKELAYSSLAAGNIQIRLVDLQPGDYDDPIRLHLRTVTLDGSVEYDALSYAWGTAISPHRTLVDGIPIAVTESLDLGLRRLRQHDHCTLWIDALCINQQDVKERNHQVQHMGSIYGMAKHVLIWLGEWSKLSLCSQSDDCLDGFREAVLNPHAFLDYNEVHFHEHLKDILELPWFGRLWM